MTERRDIEELLREFYEEGPDVLPADVHRAVIGRLALAPQRRRVRFGKRAEAAGGAIAVAAAAIVLALFLGARAVGPSPFTVGTSSGPSSGRPATLPQTPRPILEPVSAPPGWPTFRSSRFGYSIEHPAAFAAVEVDGTYNPTSGLPMNAPGTDVLNDPGVAQVGIVRLAVGQGITIDEWRNEVRVKDSSCPDPDIVASTTIDGAPAAVELGHCLERYLAVAYVVRGSFGYLLEWSSPQGSEGADLVTFREILGSMRFGG